MKRLTIAHVVSTSPPYEGGMGTVAVNLVRELRKRGYEADVISPGQGLSPWFHYGNANFNPELLWKLRTYDIVHLHYGFFGGAEFILFAKLFGTLKAKLVLHYHNDVVGVGIVKPIAWLDEVLFLKSLLRNAEAVIALSRHHIQHSNRLSQYYNNIKNKLHILPNGVDVERFSPDSRHPEFYSGSNKENQKQKDPVVISSGVIAEPRNPTIECNSSMMGSLDKARDDNHEIVIGFVGALDQAHYFKGVDNLIKGFALAREKNNALHLLIVGGGDLQKGLEYLAQTLLPKGSYTFTGLISNEHVPEYIRQMDFFVLPSFEVESFGIVLIEALAMGKPVIVSDLESLREVVKDETIGLTFRRGDVYDLAEKILEMTQRDREAMGLEGRNYVVEKYSWEKVGKSLVEIYKLI